jgi:hypothetical protein
VIVQKGRLDFPDAFKQSTTIFLGTVSGQPEYIVANGNDGNYEMTSFAVGRVLLGEKCN